jgi:hypothetical protein
VPARRAERARYRTKLAGQSALLWNTASSPSPRKILFFSCMTPQELDRIPTLASLLLRPPCPESRPPCSCSSRSVADHLLQQQRRPVRSRPSPPAAGPADASLTSSHSSCSGYCATDLQQQLRPVPPPVNQPCRVAVVNLVPPDACAEKETLAGCSDMEIFLPL